MAVQSAREALEAPPPAPLSVLPASWKSKIGDGELFPVKVAFNVGEWNWDQALDECADATYYPALLLDWLEHLAEPLLSIDLIEKVMGSSPTRANGPPQAFSESSADSAAAHKFRLLQQLPTCVMRSLDRLLNCLRILQTNLLQSEAEAKSDGSSSTARSPLFNAVCVRMAMSIFQVRTEFSETPVTPRRSSVLLNCTDFLAALISEWLAPKRLELNLESLERLRKTSSARRLHAVAPTNTVPPPKEQPASPPATLSPLKHSSDMPVMPPLDPMPRVSSSEHHSPQKTPSKLSIPLRTDQHSPRRISLGQSSASTSPIKTIAVASPRSLLRLSPDIDLPNTNDIELSLSAQSSPCALSSRVEKSDEAIGSSTLDISSSTDVMAHTSSACSLPSVRGGERYRKSASMVNGLP